MKNFIMVCINCGIKGRVSIGFNTDKPQEIDISCSTCNKSEKQYMLIIKPNKSKS